AEPPADACLRTGAARPVALGRLLPRRHRSRRPARPGVRARGFPPALGVPERGVLDDRCPRVGRGLPARRADWCGRLGTVTHLGGAAWLHLLAARMIVCAVVPTTSQAVIETARSSLPPSFPRSLSRAPRLSARRPVCCWTPRTSRAEYCRTERRHRC